VTSRTAHEVIRLKYCDQILWGTKKRKKERRAKWCFNLLNEAGNMMSDFSTSELTSGRGHWFANRCRITPQWLLVLFSASKFNKRWCSPATCFDRCQLPINTYGMLIRPRSLPLQGPFFQTLHHKCFYFHESSCAICICVLRVWGNRGESQRGTSIAATCESMDWKHLEIVCSSNYLGQLDDCGL